MCPSKAARTVKSKVKWGNAWSRGRGGSFFGGRGAVIELTKALEIERHKDVMKMLYIVSTYNLIHFSSDEYSIGDGMLSPIVHTK